MVSEELKMEQSRLKKTGTTTVGLVCKDGIVLAADKKATLGGMIVSSKTMEKVISINDTLALTVAGLVSDIQLLVKLVKAQIKVDELRKGKSLKVRESVNILANLVYNNSRKYSAIPGITGFLVGGVDKTGCYLYDLGMDGSLNLVDDYACDGSGMVFAMGALEANYKPNMSVDEGIKIAVAAVSAAVQRDTASGCGIDVIAITKDGAKKVLTKHLDTKMSV